MTGRLIIANSSANEPPHDPVIGLLRIVEDSLLDFLNCLAHLAHFVKREGPVTEAEVVAVGVVRVGLGTHVDGFGVKLVHVVNESQIIEGKDVFIIEIAAKLEMLHGLVVASELEVCQAQIILNLSII